MKFLISIGSALAIFLCLHAANCFAQENEGGDGNTTDAALNAIQVILNVVNKETLPQCSTVYSQKRLRFCPLVAKCPNEKPFCVLRGARRERSRLVTYSCVCSTTPATITPAPTPTPTPRPTVTPRPGSNGVVDGTIVLTNMCGGAQREGDDCNRAYVGNYDILKSVEGSAGAVVVHGTTNADGRFEKSLAAGNYLLRVGGTGDDAGLRSSSVQFKVESGKETKVRLLVDSGIRDPMPQ